MGMKFKADSWRFDKVSEVFETGMEFCWVDTEEIDGIGLSLKRFGPSEEGKNHILYLLKQLDYTPKTNFFKILI